MSETSRATAAKTLAPAPPVAAARQAQAAPESGFVVNLAMAQLARSGVGVGVSFSGPPLGNQEQQSRSRLGAPLTVQRACCADCDCDEPVLRAADDINVPNEGNVRSLVERATRDWGQPLDSSLRAEVEPRLGHSLADVRVHAGPQAATSARALAARAFTVGSDVVLGAGQGHPSTTEGRKLLAHELAHVAQQGRGLSTESLVSDKGDPAEREAEAFAEGLTGPVRATLSAHVHRDGTGGGSAASNDAGKRDAGRGSAASNDAGKRDAGEEFDPENEAAKLREKEAEAAKGVAGLVGGSAGSYQYVSQVKLEKAKLEGKQLPPSTASLVIGELLPRSSALDQRKGFDTADAATAFASTAATNTGAVVVTKDFFFFAMRLQPATGGTGFNRDSVYRFTPAPRVLAAIGTDGFRFAAGRNYEPDLGINALSSVATQPESEAGGMAVPPPTKDLARLAGIQREGEGLPPLPEGEEDQGKVEITPTMVEGFLRQYFVARGLEVLQANEALARKEMLTFRGTETGYPQTAEIPQAAQKQIDSSRKVGEKFRELLDREIWLEELMSRLGRERSFATSRAIVELLPGHKLRISTWKDRIQSSQKLVADAKAGILGRNPLLAQLVEIRQPRSQLEIDVRYAVDKVGPLAGGVGGAIALWDKITGPNNPYEGSELARSKSAEGDQKVRSEYVKKLDDILKTIGQVKVKVLGADLRELASMPGLKQRVMADLSTIKHKNSNLKQALFDKIAELGASAGEIASTIASVAGAALQIAGFFFPPLEFIGAVLSFGAAAYNLNRSLEAWTVSNAAVTPDQALVDRAAAEAQLMDETINLAMEAINTGVALNGAFKALEVGRAPKSFLKAEEELATRAQSVAESGHLEKPSPRQIDNELEHVAESPHIVEGTPPKRQARIGEHTWNEDAFGWCRHSNDEFCVPKQFLPDALAGKEIATAGEIEQAAAGSRKARYKALDPAGNSIDPAAGLSLKQETDFRTNIERAGGGEESLKARYERYQARMANREPPPPEVWDFEKWKKNNPQLREDVQRGMQIEGEAVKSVGATSQRKSHTFFDDVTQRDVTTITDGIRGNDVVESKYMAESEVLYDSPQLRAQRDLAHNRLHGKHEIVISSDSVDGLTLKPPRPRPSSTVGEGSEVRFFDPKQGKVTHAWNNKTDVWDPL